MHKNQERLFKWGYMINDNENEAVRWRYAAQRHY